MKIVNICPQFTDGWGYQENYLPKYQKRLGHEVTIIASEYVFGDKNQMVKCDKTDYFTDYGVKIVRLKTKGDHAYEYKLRDFVGLYEALEQESPDILFVHGVQFVYMSTIIRYRKAHPAVRIFVDNHADFNNSATTWLSKHILHGVLWKHYAKKIDRYTEKWFGVLPARVDFLHHVYGIPKEKIDLLVMGADDDCAKAAREPDTRRAYREKYGVAEDDFLIVTGGKIDKAKQSVLLLMDAVNQIGDERVKLIVFGSVAAELKEALEKRCSERVKYIGWVNGDDSYPHFAMADLAVFPTKHSVFWEQVAGLGVPLLVHYWDGTTHVDQGGNAAFFTEDSVEALYQALLDIMTPERYEKMKSAALKASEKFLYSSIARQSICEDQI